MFRSRKLLDPLGIPPQRLLVQQRGSYAWTQDIPTVMDIDQFESVCNQVLSSGGAVKDPDQLFGYVHEGLRSLQRRFSPQVGV